MSVSKSLTTKEVARLCRVSDATVKRWEESGLLKSERTSGGHRRFRAEEVARFQHEAELGIKRAHGDETVKRALGNQRRIKKSTSKSSFYENLVSGREAAAANQLIHSFLHFVPLTQIFDETVTEAMRHVGDLWYQGEITVAQEHLATRTLVQALQKLRSIIPVPQPNGYLAFCCSFEGDLHDVSPQLIQILLESRGWEVLNFGANIPFYSLVDEVLLHSPELICFSSTIINDLERGVRDYRDFRAKTYKTNSSIAIGGRAMEDTRLQQRFPAEAYLKNFTQAMEFADTIVNREKYN